MSVQDRIGLGRAGGKAERLHVAGLNRTRLGEAGEGNECYFSMTGILVINLLISTFLAFLQLMTVVIILLLLLLLSNLLLQLLLPLLLPLMITISTNFP